MPHFVAPASGSRPGRPVIPRAGQCLLDRRAFLASAIAALAGGLARADEPKPAAPADTALLTAQIEARAKQAGLRPFQSSQTRQYLGIGDAPDAFRALALQACEAIALDYFDYYDGQQFQPKRPSERFVVVTLADRRSFLAFLGKAELPAHLVGLYSRSANVLVVYDNRAPASGKAAARGRFFNDVTLAHEATHQLDFNTGLLRRDGDVPLAIVEGLALYGETRRRTGRTEPGLVNQERLRTLAYGQRQGRKWIAVRRLFLEDDLVSDPKDGDRMNFVYAHCWVLLHYLMKSPARQPQLRSYLKAVYPRTDATHRLADAQDHFANLDQLDAELREYSVQLMKRRR